MSSKPGTEVVGGRPGVRAGGVAARRSPRAGRGPAGGQSIGWPPQGPLAPALREDLAGLDGVVWSGPGGRSQLRHTRAGPAAAPRPRGRPTSAPGSRVHTGYRQLPRVQRQYALLAGEQGGEARGGPGRFPARALAQARVRRMVSATRLSAPAARATRGAGSSRPVTAPAASPASTRVRAGSASAPGTSSWSAPDRSARWAVASRCRATDATTARVAGRRRAPAARAAGRRATRRPSSTRLPACRQRDRPARAASGAHPAGRGAGWRRQLCRALRYSTSRSVHRCGPREGAGSPSRPREAGRRPRSGLG